MKILHVGIGNLGPGGVATYVRHVVSAQRARGHDILVGELWPSRATSSDVQVLLPGLSDLEAIQKDWMPDLVHCHSLIPDWSRILAPAVVTSHEHSVHCPSGARFLYGKECECHREVGVLNCLAGHYLDRCGSRHPQSILRRYRIASNVGAFGGIWIAPSRYTWEQMLRRGIPQRQCTVLHNPATFPSSPRAPGARSSRNIAYVGRLARNKGVHVLVQALRSLPRDIHLDILGEGSEAGYLARLVSELDLGSRVRFHGWAEPEAVRDLLSRSACLVVPSLWPEPFGLVVLEAFSAGCPVVASDTGGLRDMVRDGETGFLFDPGSVDGLAGGLGRIFHDRDAAEEMGRRGRLLAETTFRLEDHLDGLDVIYSRAREMP